MSLTADAAEKRMVRAVQDDTVVRLTEIGLDPARARAMVGGGMFAVAAEAGDLIDTDLEVFRPDPANDRARVLRERLERNEPIQLCVVQPLVDGRTERLQLDVPGTKAYLFADIATREATRLRMTRERHVRTAAAAAERLAREGGVVRPGMLSPDEELCLREYGAITQRRRRIAREGGYSYGERTEIAPDAARGLARVIREGAAGAAPRALREYGYWPWDEVNTLSRGSIPRVYNGALDVDGYGIEHYEQWGPNTREMQLNDVWDEQAKASWAFAHDPMVKFAIHAKVAYLLGRGMRTEANDAEPKDPHSVQAAIDEWAKRHDQAKFRRWTMYGHVLGETYLRAFELPDGRLRHVQLPSPSIWEVVTESEDVETPLYYVQRYTPRYQTFALPGNVAMYTERILPASTIVHWKINAELGESRGRSEVYASLPWHKRARDVGDAMVEREFVKNAYTTWARLNGDDEDVKAFMRAMPKGRPRPNTYVAFNDKVLDFGLFEADKGGGNVGRGTVMELLQMVAAWGYGLPKEYFGISGNSTRGGAVIAEGPIQKILELRQDDVDYGLATPCIIAVIAYAKARGVIDAGRDEGFQNIFPEIIKGDSDVRIKNLVVGRSQGWISNRGAADEWAGEMDLDNYNYDKQRETIKKEADDDGIALPGLPSNELGGISGAPADGSTRGPGGGVGGGAADPTGAPDPSSAGGGAKIRRDDRNAGREAAVAEAVRIISAAGGIVILD